MFCIYSVAFAVISPLVGKFIPTVGRRNFLIIGCILIVTSNVGFAFMHFVNNPMVFSILFVVMRIIQGIGTGIIQTTNYSIVSLVYENQVEFAIGLLESAAGFGLCFGPIIGIGLLKVGCYVGSFLTFAIIFIIFAIVIRPVLPSNLDTINEDEDEVDTSNYSYFKLLANRRILFANLSVTLNIVQYTFIDPILSHRMQQELGYDVKFTSLMFFFIRFGYFTTCNVVHITLGFISKRRCIMLFFLLNCVYTLLYGPIDLFSILKSVWIGSIAMVIAGFSSAHTLIPTYPEMLVAGTEELGMPKKVVDNLGSGLFNMNFAIGEVLGPLVGNQLIYSAVLLVLR
ncbi:unnamed protein product [Moneuplotes crassus]|uniref:Major facilitator superfamily (MFS) profile domain-containing protein n=1 Tax=Euplotes crassus TaxID=5936 RepID=A0AAD1UK82_EUPCR|nr:unnamed protein product [Moneuplotes crassus]